MSDVGPLTTSATTAPGASSCTTPLVGDLELDYEAFELPGDPGQRINVYTAPPDSPAAEALGLLASWSSPAPITSTPENEDTWSS